MKTPLLQALPPGSSKATAKLFAAKGWQVIATMRIPAGRSELNAIRNVTVLPLDVTNPAQIKETTQKGHSNG